MIDKNKNVINMGAICQCMPNPCPGAELWDLSQEIYEDDIPCDGTTIQLSSIKDCQGNWRHFPYQPNK